MEVLRDRELKSRKKIRTKYPDVVEVLEDMEISKEEQGQCLVCHQYCYSTWMEAECNVGKVSCVGHVEEVGFGFFSYNDMHFFF